MIIWETIGETIVKQLHELFKDNFIMVNKSMIKIFGLEAAVLLAELYSEYRYWEEKNQLNEFGYFYSTKENIQANTGLSRAKQERAIAVLVDYGIIKQQNLGMPSKRHFRFLEEGVKRLKLEIENGVTNTSIEKKTDSLKKPINGVMLTSTKDGKEYKFSSVW